MRMGAGWKWAAGALAAVHLTVLGAGFLAPYEAAEQHREAPLAPPGRLHLRGMRLYADEAMSGRAVPVRFFRGGKLFGVDAPGLYFPLGSDEFGRDLFSRLLYGGRVSLGVAALAAALSLGVGLAAGVTAGLVGGWADGVLMRAAELFLALPWLYLLLGVRAFLPLALEPAAAFGLMIALAGVLGWARPARIFRGLTLSLASEGYVEAARGFGAGRVYLARRHILPGLGGAIGTQAALLVPQYVLAEVTLSMFGLGINEPGLSWGTLLGAVRQPALVAMDPWVALPAVMLVPVFVLYSVCAKRLGA